MPRTRDLLGQFGQSSRATNHIAWLATPLGLNRSAKLTSDDPLNTISGSNGLITSFVVVVVLSAIMLAVLSAQSAEPRNCASHRHTCTELDSPDSE